MLKPPINQTEIARRAGVSRATVSFVLNDRLRSRVNVDTCERIFKIIKESGYRPHRYAQVMRKGRSGMIGMIHMPTYMQTGVQRSIFAAREVNAAGYQLLSINVASSDEGLSTTFDTMIDARVEGLIFDGTVSDTGLSQLKRLRKMGIPIVTMGGDRVSGIPHVTADARQGMGEMTRHLISLGYQRMALVAPKYIEKHDGYRNFNLSERVQGFLKASKKEKLERAEVFYQPSLSLPDDMYEPGRLSLFKILARSKMPEAVLYINDYWAVGAFKTCYERNIGVPRQLAITGFDNTRMAEYTASALTTVSQPLEESAKKAVAVLTALARGEKSVADDDIIRIPCQLIVRESCGAGLRPPIRG